MSSRSVKESSGSPLLGDDDPASATVLNAAGRATAVVVCDHGGEAVPAKLDGLGLDPADRARHIAWDIGASATARELAQRIGAPLSIVDKRREKAGEIAEMTVIGDVAGKACIIVDDICDTAGTLVKAAQLLTDNGATEVHAYISHGVLSGPAVERVSKSVMKSLVITDSIQPAKAVKEAPNIRIVPTAPMFTQAILNIWNGTSVSSLFETDTLLPIYEGLYTTG